MVCARATTETDGAALGLDLTRLKWVVAALLAGLLPGWLLAPAIGLPLAAGIIFGPAALVALVQLALFQDRPPGWFMDWLDTRLTGAHLTPLHFHHSCLDE